MTSFDATRKVSQWGNAYCVIITREAKIFGIAPGDPVRIHVEKIEACDNSDTAKTTHIETE